MSDATMDHLRLQRGSRVLLVGQANRYRGQRATVLRVLADSLIVQLDASAGMEAACPKAFSRCFVVELEAPPAPRREPVW